MPGVRAVVTTVFLLGAASVMASELESARDRQDRAALEKSVAELQAKASQWQKAQPADPARIPAELLAIFNIAPEQRNDAQVIAVQASMSEPDTVSVRGSALTKKEPGLYAAGHNIPFRSGYEKLPSKTQAEWAYDLHEFVLSKGGGYDNMVKYIQENAAKGVKKPLFGSYASDSKPDPYDPDTRAHVSYSEQKKFAQEWWTARDDGFKAALMKDWWLNDAILDGTNIWFQHERKSTGGADAQAWRDSELTSLVKRQ